MVNWTGYWVWLQWYLGEGLFKIYGPRFEPKRPRRHPGNIGWKDGAAWWARFAIFLANRKKVQPLPPPPPTTKHLIFDELGAFVTSASSFPFDSNKAKAFRLAGGKWVAVQFWDPVSHAFNVWEINNAHWAEKWRSVGVKVFGWHRVEHFLTLNPIVGDVDGWIFNPESIEEMPTLTQQIKSMRLNKPNWPIGIITLGKQLGFPTGLLPQLDIHLIMENFIQEGGADDDVESSYNFWRNSQVPHQFIHSCLLFKANIRTDPTDEVKVINSLNIKGISTFTAENTPPTSWQIMSQ